MKNRRFVITWLIFVGFLVTSRVNFVLAQKTVSLIENDIRALNGGVRAGMGGRSRVTIPIQIPRHATGLVYTVQAYRNTETPQALKLVMLVGTFFASGNPPLANMVSNMQIPVSTQTVDAYIITNQKDEALFINKNDYHWATYSLADRPACVNCRVSLEFKPQEQEQEQIVYLALRNPSALEAIKVQVNAVAIIPQ